MIEWGSGSERELCLSVLGSWEGCRGGCCGGGCRAAAVLPLMCAGYQRGLRVYAVASSTLANHALATPGTVTAREPPEAGRRAKGAWLGQSKSRKGSERQRRMEVEGRRGDSSDPSPRARLFEGKGAHPPRRTSARWAGVAVKGRCSHLGDRAPAKRKREVLLELAHEHVRRADPSRAFAWRRGRAATQAPCPPVVSSSQGEKIDPVAAHMASYLVCLRSSARFALARTSLRGSCSSEQHDVTHSCWPGHLNREKLVIDR